VNAALLDLHTLLWLVDDSPKLSGPAPNRIRTPGIELFFSHAGAWEIAIKYGLGKLSLPQAPQFYLEKHLSLLKVRYLPISVQSIYLSGTLPHHHGDPFDRLMVAQCRYADLPIVSADPKLDAYGVRRIW
jgi:PIN domain nuclease of toxin-antitoxin system